jgi:hypothetical protein
MKPLHLTLKKKWFDMTASCEKPEEYREIKPYWISRLIDWSEYPKESKDDHKYIKENIVYDIEQGHHWENVLKSYFSKIKPYTHCYIRLGYSTDAPQLLREINEIVIHQGNPEWGAEPGKLYFVIRYKRLDKN